VVNGRWSKKHDEPKQWSMVNGRWSMVNGRTKQNPTQHLIIRIFICKICRNVFQPKLNYDPMQKRFTTLALVVLSVFLFSYSCQDHVVPGIPPQLKTLEFVVSQNVKCGLVYTVDVTDVGTIPVKEYGVVFSAVNDGKPFTATPTVADNIKVIVDLPFVAGPKSNTGPGICTNRINYRAYAILEDDSVVYGNTLNYHDD
jgi:hypothetical protein